MEKLGQPKMTPLKRSEFISDMRTTASLAPSAMAGWVSRRGSLPGWVPSRALAPYPYPRQTRQTDRQRNARPNTPGGAYPYPKGPNAKPAPYQVRTEDYPIMPAEHVSFSLKPCGFFDSAPCTDVPCDACAGRPDQPLTSKL